MVTVTIRFYGLIRLLKKLTVTTSIRSEADRAVKTDCEVNAVVSGGTQPHLKKNLVTRQTMNCPNTQKRKKVVMNTENNQYTGRVLDIKKASEYLGLPTYTLRRVFYSSQQREPVPTRIGHRVYFTPDALDQFVSDKTEWFKDGRS